MSDKRPALVAFEQEENSGKYNVWRFTPYTECVLFGVEAKSEEQATQKARMKLLDLPEADA